MNFYAHIDSLIQVLCLWKPGTLNYINLVIFVQLRLIGSSQTELTTDQLYQTIFMTNDNGF